MTWAKLEQQLAKSDLSEPQRRNLLDLIMALNDRIPPAETATNPYDGGFSFHWSRYEVATYEDRFETYEFEDRRTDIKHWPRNANEGVPAGLIEDARRYVPAR